MSTSSQNQQFIDANGINLRVQWYTEQSDPKEPVIVLLHQGLGSVTQWRAFPTILSKATGLPVVSYDRLGHGASDPLTNPRPTNFLDIEANHFLPLILKKLNIARPIIYGHSDGATIALMFAATYPEMPLAVISEAAHVFSEVHETGGVIALKEEFKSGTLRARLARHHPNNVDLMFSAWTELWLSPEMKSWNILNSLSKIKAPTLVLQGRSDDHGTLAQVNEILTRISGRCDVTLFPGIGHMPHLEITDTVVQRVSLFLKDIL